MNNRLKRILTLITIMMFIFTGMAATGMTAFAADVKDIWYVGWEDDTRQQYIGNKGKGRFYLDAKNYYGDSRYSIVLDNGDAHTSMRIEKAVDLEPNTTYRFSAMVKYADYKRSPESPDTSSGALIDVWRLKGGTKRAYAASSITTSEKWTKLEFTFKTGANANEKYYLNLRNGNNCQGTAWFSDIKLEKAELTNKYDTLVIVFKNVDAKIDISGMSTNLNKTKDGIVRYQNSFTESDIDAIKQAAYGMSERMNLYAEGRMVFENIDIVTTDTVITENALGVHNKGYMIDHFSEIVSGVLDECLSKKTYQQIILYSPIGDITDNWAGLGGVKHRGIRFCQSVCGESWSLEYRIRNMCHEILHCIEFDSKAINPELTPDFHAHADFGYATSDEKWKDAYIDASLPGGKGIDSRAYWVPSGEYALISDDMTVGGLVDTSALPLKLSMVKAAKIADQFYTGKSIKPDVVLKDGKYTLKKGVDYTISYKNNKNVGTATVIIQGKGIYTGTKKVTFKIVKKPPSTEAPTVTAKIVDGKIKVSWNKVDGAGKYLIWISEGGNGFKYLKTVKSSTTSISMEYNSGTRYRFVVRAYIPELKKYTKYGYSNTIR